MEEIYKDKRDKGMYKCGKCNVKLFDSTSKFDSRTQWPSFRKSMKGTVATKPDLSHGMVRTEILCEKCGNHLGHVFDDGKMCGDTHPEAGKRFCVLSSSLKFEKK
ncbi:MAG: peptide-methionine (R)-S-oxide reductase [Candidatus Aenigmarchaeota archaeon]|nr:peptide-methionine (R)-S-oxide reductase [Candidatus Aenigmarchaeota archaeon]